MFVVGTPLGNLEDLTFRAARILGEVELIAAEDTRRTRTLLKHYRLSTPVVSYREQNHRRILPQLLQILGEGKSVALVSDAGTPLVADPGALLIAEASLKGVKVEPVPGPSAVSCALSAAGLPAENFIFTGFLPARKTARRKFLETLKPETRTMVFFEAPHRLKEALKDIVEVLGPRPAVLCREMTKRFEEFIRGDLAEISRLVEERDVRGEITLVVAGGPENNTGLTREELVEAIRGDERPVKEIAAEFARSTDLSRSELYRLILDITRAS